MLAAACGKLAAASSLTTASFVPLSACQGSYTHAVVMCCRQSKSQAEQAHHTVNANMAPQTYSVAEGEKDAQAFVTSQSVSLQPAELKWLSVVEPGITQQGIMSEACCEQQTGSKTHSSTIGRASCPRSDLLTGGAREMGKSHRLGRSH